MTSKLKWGEAEILLVGPFKCLVVDIYVNCSWYAHIIAKIVREGKANVGKIDAIL